MCYFYSLAIKDRMYTCVYLTALIYMNVLVLCRKASTLLSAVNASYHCRITENHRKSLKLLLIKRNKKNKSLGQNINCYRETLTAMFVSLFHEWRSTSKKITARTERYYIFTPGFPQVPPLIRSLCAVVGKGKWMTYQLSNHSQEGTSMSQSFFRKRDMVENRWKN